MAAFWNRDKPRVVDSRPTNSIIAASQRIRPDAYGNLLIPRSEWAQEAWRQFYLNGELHFAATWKANSFSRCRLTVVDVDETGKPLGETKNAQAREIGMGLGGNPARQAQLMRSFGAHMMVTGDCYVVGEVGPSGDFQRWCVYSTEEIRSGGPGKFIIDIGDGRPKTYLTSESIVIRVYRPDPRRSWEADSPTRAALPVLREIEQLVKYEFAVMDSRLATAGVFLVPAGLEFPDPGDDMEPGESPLMAYLAQVFMASIANRNSAAAVVPITLQGPKEELDGVRWIAPPNADLTVTVSELIEKAIRRLALALDMPPEVLLGLGTANDWSAASLEEAAIKIYIEPDVMLVCDALTEGYLQPALEAAGLDPSRFAYWYDPARLILRPNRSVDAKDLYDRGELSGAALRYATGFTEEDKPTGQEKCILDLLSIVRAAPRSGDALLPILLELFKVTNCGIDQELIDMLQPQPQNGTPPLPPGAPDPNTDPRPTAPEPGVDGNGAPGTPAA